MAKGVKGFESKSDAKEKSKSSHSPEVEEKRSVTKKYNKLIKGDIYDEIRRAFINPVDGSKKPYYQEFIKKYVTIGMDNPESTPGQMIASQIFTDGIIEKLDEQTEKALAKDTDFTQYRLQKRLFKRQKEVFNDFTSPRIAVMCSRRAGKTENNSDIINRVAAVPNSPILYINLTFDNAIRQMYNRVIQEAERAGLLITKDSKANGYIEFANGSTVLFKGNKDRSEADKMQGDKYRLVIIDEAQSQVNMLYLVDTIIRPMLTDYSDSQLILTGTPPRRRGTYFESVFNNVRWTKYNWNMFENPFIPDPEKAIQDICMEKGVDRNSPFIKREYYGEIAYDTEAQVFKNYTVYKGAIPNDFIPTHIYEGVDFGFADYNGIVVMAANVDQKRAYIIFERKFNKSTITEIVEVIREGFENGKRFILERNSNADLSNCSIYTDNNEKSITYELSQTYGLPAYCAYKYNKAMAIEQLADCCRSGKISIPEGGAIADEFEQTLYKRDDLDNITSEIDDSYHPDITMALLYASRQFFFDCGMDTGGESSNKQSGEF